MTNASELPRLMRHALGTLLICAIVGVLLYLRNGRAFWLGMVYSYAIGVQISIFISLFNYGLARLRLRWQPDNEILRDGWVGWVWITPGILVGTLLGFMGGVALGDWLTGQRSTYLWEQRGAAAQFSIGFTLLVSVLATAAFAAYFRQQRLRADRAQAEALAADARLTLLQSQLEPHMLFNTLAHLRVLIKLRPDEAQTMLDQLIGYLRATLQASRATQHPLSDEFARIADYLALMRIRMGERLQTELDLPPELAGLPVPPLLLQPLVENAIKHGLEPQVAGGRLRVSARRIAQGIELCVADSGVGPGKAPASSGTGFGQAQVRERLAQRYGTAASFDFRAGADAGSVATITLPCP